MKRIVIFLSVLIFAIFSIASIVDADRGNKKQKRQKDRYHQKDKSQRDYGRGYDRYYFQKRPHDYGRRHGHGPKRNYHGPKYHYKGHWYSRHKWERYRHRHPERYRGGKYHRDDGGHLMFSFCHKGEGVCFSFSIDD